MRGKRRIDAEMAIVFEFNSQAKLRNSHFISHYKHLVRPAISIGERFAEFSFRFVSTVVPYFFSRSPLFFRSLFAYRLKSILRTLCECVFVGVPSEGHLRWILEILRWLAFSKHSTTNANNRDPLNETQTRKQEKNGRKKKENGNQDYTHTQ